MIALNRSVKVRAPIRRGCALSFENAISIGLRSGPYGGKNKNQHPALYQAVRKLTHGGFPKRQKSESIAVDQGGHGHGCSDSIAVGL